MLFRMRAGVKIKAGVGMRRKSRKKTTLLTINVGLPSHILGRNE